LPATVPDNGVLPFSSSDALFAVASLTSAVLDPRLNRVIEVAPGMVVFHSVNSRSRERKNMPNAIMMPKFYITGVSGDSHL